MKTAKSKTIAVIKNGHTKKEMAEIEREFVNSNGPYYTLQQVLEMSRNENLHKDRG